MNAFAYLVAFTMSICGLVSIELPASAASADITGTWEVTIHYPPPDGDYQATYVLNQDGEKITGTYHGLCGPADVTGTIKSEGVVLSVTVNCNHGQITARFSGKVSSATKMSGTVTFVVDSSLPTAGDGKAATKWSAEKKKSLVWRGASRTAGSAVAAANQATNTLRRIGVRGRGAVHRALPQRQARRSGVPEHL
jgi:hypothetical protein